MVLTLLLKKETSMLPSHVILYAPICRKTARNTQCVDGNMRLDRSYTLTIGIMRKSNNLGCFMSDTALNLKIWNL